MGGYVELCRLPGALAGAKLGTVSAYCDEEGAPKRLAHNRWSDDYAPIFGPIVLATAAGNRFTPSRAAAIHAKINDQIQREIAARTDDDSSQ